MYETNLYFKYENLKLDEKDLSITPVKLNELLLGYLACFNSLGADINLSYELISEVDIFSGGGNLTSEEKRDLRDRYFFDSPFEMKKLMLSYNNEFNALTKCPLFKLTVNHIDEFDDSIELMNYLDRFSLLVRINTNSCIKIQKYCSITNQVTIVGGKVNYYHHLKHQFYDDNMLFEKNQYCSSEQIFGVDVKDLVEINELLDYATKHINNPRFDIRNLYQSFYSFGESTKSLNLTLLVVLCESLIPSFEKNNVLIDKKNKKRERINNRIKMECILKELNLSEYNKIFHLAYEIRNVFSHGNTFQKNIIKKCFSNYKLIKDGATWDDFYLSIRGELINLILMMIQRHNEYIWES